MLAHVFVRLCAHAHTHTHINVCCDADVGDDDVVRNKNKWCSDCQCLFLCFYTFGCRFSERKRAERTSVSLFFEHTDSFTLNKLECSRQALADSQVVSFFNSANNTYISADISNNALLIYFVAARFC
jgi:hypothetical protein